MSLFWVHDDHYSQEVHPGPGGKGARSGNLSEPVRTELRS